MSTEKEKIFESFGNVLKAIMHRRGRNQSWLADKTGKDKKQISDYVNNNTTPFNDTLQDIADSLGVGIEKREGKFILFDPYESERMSVEEMITEYKSRKETKGFSESERDLLYEVLLNDAESLAVNLRRLIEIERQSDD